MPAQPISFPRRPACQRGAERRQRSRRPRWHWLGMLPGLLLAAEIDARNACAGELDGLSMTADASEVLRDARVMIGGLPMCTLAYTTETGLDALMARYRQDWQAHPGVLQATDSNGDGRDDTVWQASDTFSRRLAVRSDGAGHAVMISLMPLDTANPPAPRPYLPLPAGFEIEFQSRNAAGASVHARTALGPASAARALTRTLEAAGWRGSDVDDPGIAGRRRIRLHRDGEAIRVELLRRSGQTLVLAQRVTPGGTP
ncbi:hypothetical protein [Spiribacter roseus]|uniref:Uncharacterized protein n=1 Tax=Spiribacter roseus TaxID=1855875 RepID=A0ABV3RX24_9GAMM